MVTLLAHPFLVHEAHIDVFVFASQGNVYVNVIDRLSDAEALRVSEPIHGLCGGILRHPLFKRLNPDDQEKIISLRYEIFVAIGTKRTLREEVGRRLQIF
jgi:hypothetical protein